MQTILPTKISNAIKKFCAIALSRKYFPTTVLTLLSLIFFIPSIIFEPITFGGANKGTFVCIVSALLYSFSHVNIFHLGINLIALIRFRPRLSTATVALIIAICIAVLRVSPDHSPTCGISVLLYAAISRYYVAWQKPILRPLLSTIFLCGINFLMHATIYNWLAHLLAFSLGYIVWLIYYRYIRPLHGARQFC